ncbi:hypothetical protein FHX37_2070 [Haloactinospora alba]|uniref:Amidohydrolase 3 domain-containing protein n=1 Tax=Haloactinospora alba TaxID=405555 RepID=A0A543NK16_9ACTN|nr:amidohydrolase [Haloactinospora alba]TQN32142.1 hypothetical protein FHX37_2070 [Haloactinospora alba]
MREGDMTVWTNGTVWSGRGRTRTHSLAARGGRIVALGAEAAALAPRAGEVVDLEGGFLMPSFGDGHAHPVVGGLELQGPRVRGLDTPGRVADAVGRWAREHPEAEWIVGGGYDPTIAPGGELDARWLDARVPDRPVVLRASDYHTAWVNTETLRRAGITADTPEPSDGVIVRRGDGAPLGTLREWGALLPVLDLAPPVTLEDRVRALSEAGRRYTVTGVTWVQDAWVDPEDVEVYRAALRRGLLRTRADLALRAVPGAWHDQLDAFARVRAGVAEEPAAAGMLTARTVKFVVDGVVEGGTAALLAPYQDTPGECGTPTWSPAELAAGVAAFDRRGFRVHLHAIGDAAVRSALDAVEHARRENPAWDRRPVIAHTQLVDPRDLDRFAELGVVANLEPLWAQYNGIQRELTIPRLGEERSCRQYPAASLRDSGARLSFGSDWPVSSHRPLDGIQVGVSRRTPAGYPPGGWLPHERIGVEEALEAYTAGSAYQAGAEHGWGTVTPGANADLVWLDNDPRSVDETRIGAVAERGTWLGGERVS